MAIDIKKFNDPAFANQARQAASDALRTANVSAGMDLWSALHTLERQREQLDSSVRPLYAAAIKDAFFAAFPALPNRAIIDALPEYLSAIIDNGSYDLLDQFKKKLATIEIIEDRDELRRLVREALTASEVTLADAPMVAGQEKRPGTIKEWMALYLSAVGGGKTDTVKRAEFLSGRSVMSLSDIGRARVERLTKFFDYLKLSSLDPEGIPEELEADFVDEVYILREGKLERVTPFEDALVQDTANLLQAYQEDLATRSSEMGPLEQRAQEMAKRMKFTGALAQEMVRASLDPKQKPKEEEVVGALQVIFKNGKITDFLRGIEPDMMRYLQSAHVGDDATLGRRMAILKEGLELPGTVELFFKIILVERLGLSTAHAAAIAARLISRLPESERAGYFDIAYYDMASGEFHWGGSGM